MKTFATTGLALSCLLMPQCVNASCGSAFCTVNTDWNAQAPWQNSATQLDVRTEYIHQNQVRSGTRKSVDAGHHEEVETYNRNTWLTLSQAFTPELNVSVQVPIVSRDHLHVHHHHGVPLRDRWDFTELGDMRILAHARLDDIPASGRTAYGLIAGVKLPTGSTDQRNRAGDLAERSLQPGSGSTDAIAGAYVSGQLHEADWHTQLRWQHAVSERKAYRPGDQVALDASVRYPLASVYLLGQVNVLWRGHDRGTNAEPVDSGGRFVYVSPGVVVPIGTTLQAYGLVQLPVYQKVYGTQLTADWAATMGLTMRF